MSTEGVEEMRSGELEIVICYDSYFQDLSLFQSVFCPPQHCVCLCVCTNHLSYS